MTARDYIGCWIFAVVYTGFVLGLIYGGGAVLGTAGEWIGMVIALLILFVGGFIAMDL